MFKVVQKQHQHQLRGALSASIQVPCFSFGKKISLEEKARQLKEAEPDGPAAVIERIKNTG